MYNRLKKVITTVIIVALLMVNMPGSFAEDSNPSRLVVNDEVITTDVPPQLIDGRTMVPVRFVSQALGAEVIWDQTRQAVLINSAQSDAAPRGEHIQLIVNGATITPDVPPQLIDGRTMVPVRFVSQALGATINWNQEARTVSIDNDGTAEEVTRPDVAAELVSYDSFQLESSGEKPTEFGIELTGNAQAVIENIPTPENRSMLISAEDGSVELLKEFNDLHQMATVEFKFMQTSKSDVEMFQILDDEAVIAEIVTTNGNIALRNGVGEHVVIVNDYTENIWYTLKMVVDLKNGQTELFVNEFPVNTNAQLGQTTDKVNAIKFQASNKSAYYVDDVIVGAGRLDIPMGFATVGTLPTGGIDGETVIVETLAEFLEYASKPEPLIMKISGTIDMDGKMHSVESNKTIVGIGDSAVIKNGGIRIASAENVIIRNLLFDGSTDDAIEIRDMAKNIWIDHNTFQNAADGLLDIRRQSSYVTVSWNLFQDHGKTSLVGSGDNDTFDRGYLKVTYHHNKFYNTRTRHPMVRFGEVHVLNNYYDSLGSYAARANREASVLVESNYFYQVKTPTEVFDGNGGDIEARNNMLVDSGQPEEKGTVFNPFTYYTYSIDPAEQINEIVEDWVGAGQIHYY